MRLAQTLAFGYVILIGANILSDGSELLLEILDPGLVGGTFRLPASIYLILNTDLCCQGAPSLLAPLHAVCGLQLLTAQSYA